MIHSSIISNPIIDRLPKHLHQYIKPQDYESYTPINQAVWRYVMHRNVSYLSTVAHGSYLEGLRQTGISTEQIPSMYGMNRILKEIGWAAVAVDGFIPPSAFMEFQAYNVLVIAADIRQLKNMEYTPAPDIIHESAGHAPIIANPEYAEYLRRFGEIGSKAISSAYDWEVYEAIRTLSQLKEQVGVSANAITAAEQQLDVLQQQKGKLSEMERVRNLHWWTVEYGLIGTPEDYKIYGAGLLSSIGESKWCMGNAVKKLPYSVDAAYQCYDITKPQPQLFVTPDFAYLSLVLEEFANTMAVRKGGTKGVKQLIESDSLGTIELSTGLQISGTFSRMITNERGKVAFIQTKGKTALAYREKELIGHGTAQHPNGFGSPIGKLKGINLAIEDMSPRDLEAYDIYEGKTVELEFEGGIRLKGDVVTGTRSLKGKIVLITFQNCLVTYKDEVLFDPSWGTYHLAVGKKVASVFAGPADFNSFNLISHELSPSYRALHKSDKEVRLEQLYQTLRDIRGGKGEQPNLSAIFEEVQSNYDKEWLLTLEINELAQTQQNFQLATQTEQALKRIKKEQAEVGHLIDAGLEQFRKSVTA